MDILTSYHIWSYNMACSMKIMIDLIYDVSIAVDTRFASSIYSDKVGFVVDSSLTSTHQTLSGVAKFSKACLLVGTVRKK